MDEVADELHLSAGHFVAAIERFATERDARRASLRSASEAIGSGAGGVL